MLLRGGKAFVKNGKWGFADRSYYVAPQFDSLFTIYLKDMDGKHLASSIVGVVGVMVDGKKGVVGSDGEEIVLHKDYVDFRYRFNQPISRFEIICMHKSGVEVIYNRGGKLSNKYIVTHDKDGLVGYVYDGEFQAPVYKKVERSDIPGIQFACTLPDGKVEYRNGAVLVPAAKVEEQIVYAAELKKREEAAAKQREEDAILEKERAIRKQEALDKLLETREDSVIASLMGIYTKRHKALYEQVNKIQQYLRFTTMQNSSGEFNRSQWMESGRHLKNTMLKDANAQLKLYSSDFEQFKYLKDKLDFHLAIEGYLYEVRRFLSASDTWAEYIEGYGGEDSETFEHIERLNKCVQAMDLGAKFCQGIYTEYNNSKKLTGSYLTTMKAAKGAKKE